MNDEMFAFHLTKQELDIVKLALGVLQKAAFGKGEDGAVRHLESLIVRLSAAQRKIGDATPI